MLPALISQDSALSESRPCGQQTFTEDEVPFGTSSDSPLLCFNTSMSPVLFSEETAMSVSSSILDPTSQTESFLEPPASVEEQEAVALPLSPPALVRLSANAPAFVPIEAMQDLQDAEGVDDRTFFSDVSFDQMFSFVDTYPPLEEPSPSDVIYFLSELGVGFPSINSYRRFSGVSYELRDLLRGLEQDRFYLVSTHSFATYSETTDEFSVTFTVPRADERGQACSYTIGDTWFYKSRILVCDFALLANLQSGCSFDKALAPRIRKLLGIPLRGDNSVFQAAEWDYTYVPGEELQVPAYDSHVILRRQLAEVPPTAGYSNFIEAGWPAHLARRLTMNRDWVSAVKYNHTHDSEKRVVVPTNRGRVDRDQKQRYEPGQAAKLWRVPKGTPGPEVPKPRSYQRTSFRRWVSGQYTRLWTPSLRKTQFVTGNFAAQALYYGSKGSFRETSRLLSQAAIFLADYAYSPPAGGQPMPLLFEYFSKEDQLRLSPRKSLRIGTSFVTSVPELEKFKHLFKRKANFYRFASQYLSGYRIEDFDKLQAQINKMVAQSDQVSEVSLQGGVVSTPTMRHEVNVHLPLPEIFDSLNQAGLDSNVVREVVHVGSFLVSLFTSSSWQNGLSILVSFCTSANIWPRCRRLVESLPQQVSTRQAAGEWVSQVFLGPFREICAAVLECSLFSVISGAFHSITDALVPGIRAWTKMVVVSIQQQGALAIARSIIDKIQEYIGRVRRCWEIRSMLPLWGPEWDPQTWCDQSLALQAHYTTLTVSQSSAASEVTEISDLREKGRIPAEWTVPVTQPVYLQRLENHIAQGRLLLESFKTSSNIVAAVSKAIVNLQSFHDQIKVIASGQCERVEPVMIYFYGAPGVGKTNMALEMIKSIGLRHGYDLGGSGVYSWQPGSNFQDGLRHTQWAIVMDDVDVGVAPPQAGVRSHVEEVIALVNNKPYPVEQADVAHKGKIFATPLFLAYCSNITNGLAPSLSREPHAFFRRVTYHITVTVKEEFSLPGGRLDPRAASDSLTHDMWDLEIKYYDPSLPGLPFGHPKHMSLPDFMAMLQAKFSDHLRDQLQVLARRANEPECCSYCGMDMSRMCCEARKRASVDSLIESHPHAIMRTFSHITTSDPSIHKVLTAMGFYVSKVEDSPTFRESCRQSACENALWDEPELVFQGCCDSYRSRLLRMLSDPIYRDVHSIVTKVGACSAALAVVWLALRLLGSGLDKKIAEQVQAREGMSNSGLLPEKWVRADQAFTPGLPGFGTSTFTKEDIVRAIQEAHVMIHFLSGPELTPSSLNGTVIAHNAILTCREAVLSPTKVLTVIQNGREVEVPISGHTVRQLPESPELVIVLCNGLRGGLTTTVKMWQNVDESVRQFDEIEIWGRGLMYTPTQNSIRLNVTPGIITSAQTQEGDCGSLYLARHNSSWKIVAMHYALVRIENGVTRVATSWSNGQFVTQITLQRLLRSLGTDEACVQMVRQSVSKCPEMVQLGAYSPKSEIWAARGGDNAPVHNLGRLDPPLPGSSMKSKMQFSLFGEEAEELVEEFCGRPDYWQFPQFRGLMTDAGWDSPWTRMFATTNTGKPDPFFMKVALCDMLQGIMELDREGYSVISEEQAIRGIPGSYVGPVNMKTSVGPPYTGGKSKWMCAGEEPALSPEVASMIDEIEQILDAGNIPSVLGLCTLKDEPVKPGKAPRVFICLPYAMNLVMKRYGSSWKSFIRANHAFFESAVGINMTSRECNKIPNTLRQVCHDLQKIFENDVRAMDKSWGGDAFELVALLVYAICFSLGVEPNKNRLLILAMRFLTYSCKNDLFRTIFNPSGCDCTVELNGMNLSLGERYVYYRTHGYRGDPEVINLWFENFLQDPIPPIVPELDFRSNVALSHYGDDAVKAFAKDPAPNYIQVWREEWGFILTSASEKGDVDEMVSMPLDKVSFLKRKFLWDEEFQCYLPPISVKTIARMAIMKRESSLSRVDHAAVILTEILKEAVYHGPVFYQKMLVFANRVVDKYSLGTNPYLVRKSYAEWREEIGNDTFRTWSLREPPPPRDEDKLISLSYQMSQLDLAKAPSVEPTAVEGYETAHPVGTISATAETQLSLDTTSPLRYQNLPPVSLDDYLCRATKVGEFTVSDVDGFGTVYSFDPWANFMANPAIAAKLENFSYISGTIQVVAVVTMPAGSFGRYVVCALPNAGPVTTAYSPNLHTHNSLQVDHYGVVDCARSSNVVLQLPWTWKYDYAGTAVAYAPTPEHMWRVSLQCLAPIRTGITGGFTQGYVKFYVNLMEGYELVVPHFQSKHRKLKSNAVMKAMAPDVHAAIGDGKGSAMLGKVADMAEMAASVPVIGAGAAMVSNAARTAASVMDWFGFTRDSVARLPDPITMRSVSNVAHVDGEDRGDKAALLSSNAISIDPRLVGGASEDCLANADFFNRWTLIHTTTWNSSDPTGEEICSIPVSPSYCYSSSANSLAMTTAGYYGLSFEYWRGDMEYLLMVPVSKFHRGALQVTWAPTGATVTSDPTNVAFNTIYDVSEGQDLEFSVGYARERPYLRNQIIREIMAIVPFADSTNGNIQIQVVNPLISQSSSSTATVLIFARAAQNMDFFLPRDKLQWLDSSLQPAAFDIRSQVTLQAGALGDETGQNQVVKLVPPSAPFPGDELFSGEKIMSLRALLQKPSLSLRYNVQEVTTYRWQERMINKLNVPAFQFFTYQGFYAAPFVGLACSERVKMIPQTNGFFGASRGEMSAPLPLTTNTLAPMTFTGMNRGSEFQIPYYYPEKFVRTFVQPEGTGSLDLWSYNTTSQLPNGSFPSYQVYYSYGDDIRATCFRQLPIVSFRDEPLGFLTPWVSVDLAP